MRVNANIGEKLAAYDQEIEQVDSSRSNVTKDGGADKDVKLQIRKVNTVFN